MPLRVKKQDQVPLKEKELNHDTLIDNSVDERCKTTPATLLCGTPASIAAHRWLTPQGKVATKDYFVDIQRSTIDWWYKNRRDDLPWRKGCAVRSWITPLRRTSGDEGCASSLSQSPEKDLSLCLASKDSKEKKENIDRADTEVKSVEQTAEISALTDSLQEALSPLSMKLSMMRATENSFKEAEEIEVLKEQFTGTGKEEGVLFSSHASPNSPFTPTIVNFSEDFFRGYNASSGTAIVSEKQNPYAIWVSEVMSQQTQMNTVIKYFSTWMKKFPTVEALAAASEREVRTVWAGMGYYRRAIYLLEGARYVVNAWKKQDPSGESEKKPVQLPRSAKLLQQVPGIGPYTAAAIASICYEEPIIAVDGNLVRVLCRLRGERNFNPKLSQNIKLAFQWGNELMGSGGGQKEQRAKESECVGSPCTDPGALNQGLMEIGAGICKPNGTPQCELCPLRSYCVAYAACHESHEIPAVEGWIPLKAPGLEKKVAHVVCVVHELRFPDAKEEEHAWEEKSKNANLRSTRKGTDATLSCKKKKVMRKATEQNLVGSECLKRENEEKKSSDELPEREKKLLVEKGSSYASSQRRTHKSSFVVVRRKENGLLGGMLEFPSFSIPLSVVTEHQIQESKAQSEARNKCFASDHKWLKQEAEVAPKSETILRQSILLENDGAILCKKVDSHEFNDTGSGRNLSPKRQRENRRGSSSFSRSSFSTEQISKKRKEEKGGGKSVHHRSLPVLPSLLSFPQVKEKVYALADLSGGDAAIGHKGSEKGNNGQKSSDKMGFAAKLPYFTHEKNTFSADYHIGDVEYVGVVNHIFSHINMTVYVYRRQWSAEKRCSEPASTVDGSASKLLPPFVSKIKLYNVNDLCSKLAQVLTALETTDHYEPCRSGSIKDSSCSLAKGQKVSNQQKLKKITKKIVEEKEEVGTEMSSFLSTPSSVSSSSLQLSQSTFLAENVVEETRQRISVINEADMKSGACSRLMLKIFEKVSEFSCCSPCDDEQYTNKRSKKLL